MNTTRYFAALNPARSVPQYIRSAGSSWARCPIWQASRARPSPYATVTTHIDTLDEVERAAHKGAVGAASDRDAALLVVKGDMRLLKAFLQSVADTSANPQGRIEDAGFSVAKKTVRSKQDIAAKWGANAGTVALLAKAVKSRRVQYGWQMSVDQKTWTLPHDAEGVDRGQRPDGGHGLYFRVQTQTVAALSDWSAIVSILAR